MVHKLLYNSRFKIKTLGLIFLCALLLAGSGIMGVSFFLKRDVNTVSQTWQTFQQSSSVKTRIITALWSDFGYGGMIHHLKNYVLRHDEDYYIEAKSKLEGLEGLISQYRGLGPAKEEVNALNGIKSVVNNYKEALEQTRVLIEQGKTTEEIDALVKVDDQRAIEGLTILTSIFDRSVVIDTPVLNKYRNLSNLRRYLGYGGMIHHFKNFVLRKETIHAEIARDAIEINRQLIDNFRELELTKAEKTAIKDIENINQLYLEALIRAESLIKLDYSTAQLDAEVKVNDILAFSALVTLDRALSLQTKAEADNMTATLFSLEEVISFASLVFPFAGIIFISGLIWILKARVIDPIGIVAGLTMRLARGDLSIKIDEEFLADDEIGEMAKALAIFKRNAIHRDEVENRLRKILEITPQAIITVDKNFNIQLFNWGATKVFGYLEQQIIGQSMEILIPERYREDHYKHLANYMNVRRPKNLLMGQRGEISGLRNDGTEFPAIASIASIEHGGESMYLVALVDISKQKKVERNLQKALHQKEKANQVKSEFMASMSHELRTPLNSILGFSEIMSEEHMGPMGNKQYVEYAKNIHTSGRHLLEMVNDILDIERIESGNIKLNVSEINIAELLEECRQLTDQRVAEKSLTLKIDIAKNVENFSADRRLILQVIINLLVNAIKFTEEKGNVDIKFTFENEYYAFTVKDNGIGIPAEKIAVLTDPFVRHVTDPHKTQEGVGLGLAISNSLVMLHGGTMEIESEVGSGTTITVNIPKQSREQLNLI